MARQVNRSAWRVANPGSCPIALFSIHCGVELDQLTRLHHHLCRRTVDILLEPYPSKLLDSLKLAPVHESEGFGGMRRTCPRHGGGVVRGTRR